MPLEISEIEVRMSVNEGPRLSIRNNADNDEPTLKPDSIDEIVRACTREVLRILRRLEER